MTTQDPSQRLRVSRREPEELRARLCSWLASRLPAGADPEVLSLDVPPGNGMSSETVLLDVSWREHDEVAVRALVARIAPQPESMPVYPRYDVARQFRVMSELGPVDGVPVPPALWVETDAAVLGSQFLVMERVDGLIPTDMPPYTFEGWLLDASDDQRDTLRRETLRALAALHRTPASDPRFEFLAFDLPGETPLRRHYAWERALYEWVVSDGGRSPLIENGFAWLEEHWPAESEPVVTWGDARIGNVIYRDFRPVALLDWETPGLAPAEVDVGWFIWMHWSFQDLATMLGLPGLPDLMRVDDVVADYVAAGGREPRDLQWFITYAAVRYAIVISRVGRRMIQFGERGPAAHVDDLLFNGALMRRLYEGELPAWA